MAEKSDRGSRKAGISTESWRLRRNQSGEELEEYPGEGTASAKAQRHGGAWHVQRYRESGVVVVGATLWVCGAAEGEVGEEVSMQWAPSLPTLPSRLPAHPCHAVTEASC